MLTFLYSCADLDPMQNILETIPIAYPSSSVNPCIKKEYTGYSMKKIVDFKDFAGHS